VTPEQILAAIALAESLFTTATNAWAGIRGSIDAKTQAEIDAAIAASGAKLDASTKQLDADAA